MAVMTTGLCACTGKAEAPAYMDGNGAAGGGSSMIRMTRPVPDRYFSEAAEFLRVATFLMTALMRSALFSPFGIR